jgi:hypothetical protein
MMPHRLLAAIFAMCASSACTSLNLNMSSAEVSSPELPGKSGAHEISFHYDEATRYEFTADASRRPPTLTDPSTQVSRIASGRGAYSIAEWLELGLKVFPGSRVIGGGALQARFALLGVQPGPGWKASALLSTAGHIASASGDQDGTFGNGGHNWKADASGRTTGLGLSLGYRFSDAFMMFAGYAQADHRLSGRIQHDRSDNGSSPEATYDLSEVSARSRTSTLGFRFGRSVQGALDLRAVERQWPSIGRGDARGKTTETVVAAGLVISSENR